MKNLTNGEVNLRNIDPEWKVPQKYKFIRVPGSDNSDFLKRDGSLATTSYHIENLRTGEFTEISQNYMLSTNKQKDEQQMYTTDSFETQMKLLISGFEGKLSRAATFFQGLLAGMVLLYTLALTLSGSNTVSTQLIKVQDQSIRVISMLSSFGALYALINVKSKYDNIKVKGTALQIQQYYKCFVLCVLQFIFYQISFIVVIASHEFSVRYFMQEQIGNGSLYQSLTTSTVIYTVFALLGWIITNANTYKHQIS